MQGGSHLTLVLVATCTPLAAEDIFKGFLQLTPAVFRPRFRAQLFVACQQNLNSKRGQQNLDLTSSSYSKVLAAVAARQISDKAQQLLPFGRVQP